MSPILARACIACALVISGSWACARGGELTLADALDAALRNHPDLRASAFELSAAQARSVQANLRPNPELALELENFGGSGEASDTGALETTLSLSQVLELGGRRALRRNSAAAGLEVASIEQQARELDVLAEVAARFIDVVASQEQEQLAVESVRLAQFTLDSIDGRVAAGRSPLAEQSRARIALTRARIERRQAASELGTARHVLAASWGSPEPDFTTARAALFELRAVDPVQTLIDRLDASPDLARYASEARLREAELRLARVQARPNLAVSLGLRRLEETGDTALVAGISLPLAFSDRNQAAIREAQVRLDQTGALAAAARVRARASLLALYQQVSADRERVETLRKEALPQAQLALEQTRGGYERGRFSFLDLITAQEELLALRGAAIDAAADYHRLLAQIERLTGVAAIRPTTTP
ncbi:MAG TPA: TolC family protein [Steroidobacteraceae bacterium]|nr:TolC family protein [Steroidobacteraceae bacterium]HQX78117.1 TolC family protein [Steroidobacteraceae bacterium]HQZ79150.1 TolC family protein [Steroidobacteraceae bacterium]